VPLWRPGTGPVPICLPLPLAAQISLFEPLPKPPFQAAPFLRIVVVERPLGARPSMK
jgi:hypothetical protein